MSIKNKNLESSVCLKSSKNIKGENLESASSEFSPGKSIGEEYLTSSHSLGISFENSVARQFADFPISLASTSRNVSSLLGKKTRGRKMLGSIFFEEAFK